ncbi:hypothetical protein P879_07644 [Paragonimus westermani]|uniref:DNA mismatch repair proteins mutS family domain-containing protein n=1 Tax=Paragonimus westermani TaxID=34504 RepID=A0A8T0D495_9TREM|nr:hypothetical protein P879_07644 [Paragonimus westermani]
MAYYRNDTTRGRFIIYSPNTFVIELDKRYGDVMYAIIDSETAIMHRLQDRILEHSKHILRAHQFAAEMDCLCAFAQAASSMKGVRPKLVQESLIRITNGWHPIQQLLSIDTIRNSFFSGGSHERTTIVTGPNASGKSIYLKQIGLIIYLSQIGSFVPAEKVIVGPVDAIYVTSADDFNQGDCSAYSLSLNTASIALKHSTFKTTVLLDEFAHCINKTEAAALTVSIIEFFQRKKHPHLIASTHNMDIIENLKAQDTVKLITMKTITHRGKIVYLYEASDGITRSSHATEVAKIAGIPASIIKRAQTLADLTDRGSRKKLDTSKYRDVLSKLEHVDTNRMTTDLFRLLKSIEHVLS